jgi:hypothetical protein
VIAITTSQAWFINGRRQPPRTWHIHPILYVKNTRAMVRLDNLYIAQIRRSKYRNTPTSDALWAGMCALNEKADTMLALARDDGLLLMCWEGSSIVEFYDRKKVAA